MQRGSSLTLEVDKNQYLPGDTIHGSVLLRVQRNTLIRHLQVQLQGLERVVVPAGRTSYTRTNEMYELTLHLLENEALAPSERALPFEFKIPENALPSYVGRNANVAWKLSAKADIPWAADLLDELFLRVQYSISIDPMPVSMENHGAKPSLRLQLPSNIYQPSDILEGTLTLTSEGNFRAIRLDLLLTERAEASGTVYPASKTERRVISEIQFAREQIPVGVRVPFRIEIPDQAPCSYSGAYSSILYSIGAVIDIPYAADIHLNAPIIIGLRRKPISAEIPTPITQQSGTMQAESTRQSEEVISQPPAHAEEPEEEPAAPLDRTAAQIEPSKQPPEAPSPTQLQLTEQQSLVVSTLRDGAPKDIVTISTEIQLHSGGFIDLNQVRKLCEELVEQGTLIRTGEGEFFAKYSLPRRDLQA